MKPHDLEIVLIDDNGEYKEIARKNLSCGLRCIKPTKEITLDDLRGAKVILVSAIYWSSWRGGILRNRVVELDTNGALSLAILSDPIKNCNIGHFVHDTRVSGVLNKWDFAQVEQWIDGAWQKYLTLKRAESIESPFLAKLKVH